MGTIIGEVGCHGSVGAVHASAKGVEGTETREELLRADVGMTAGRKSVPEPWNRRLRGGTTILGCLMHEVCHGMVPTSGLEYGAARSMWSDIVEYPRMTDGTHDGLKRTCATKSKAYAIHKLVLIKSWAVMTVVLPLPGVVNAHVAELTDTRAR